MSTERSAGALVFRVGYHREAAENGWDEPRKREVYARFCGRLEVKSLRPTRHRMTTLGMPTSARTR